MKEEEWIKKVLVLDSQYPTNNGDIYTSENYAV